VSELTRLTNAFSKKLANLKAAIARFQRLFGDRDSESPWVAHPPDLFRWLSRFGIGLPEVSETEPGSMKGLAVSALYEAQMLQTTGWYANESAEVEDSKYRNG
jgi:hypothetical protein